MAEGTRLRDLSEHLATLEGKLQKLTTDYQGKVRELSSQILEVKEVGQKHYEDLQAEATKRHDMVLRDNTTRHEELLKLLSNHVLPSKMVSRDNEDPNELRFQNHKLVGSSSQGRIRENKGKGILPAPEIDAEFDNDGRSNRGSVRYTNQQHMPLPKLEFPYFSGDEPGAWIENCEQYFEVYQIPQHQWVGIAGMHLKGRARSWKQSYFVNRPRVTWGEFIEALNRRFAQVGERYLVREFSNLKQTGTVEKYQDKFEELKTQLLSYNPQLTEEYLIACYINGLKEELIPFLDIAHPNTLEEAYEQATLHERALSAMSRKWRGNYKPITQQPQLTNTKTATGGTGVVTQPKGSGNQYPSSNRQLIEQRRAAGLCFKCGEKYQPGHQCSLKGLNLIQGEDDLLEIYDESCITEEREDAEEGRNTKETDGDIRELGVSVHALSGGKTQDTIKVPGESKGKTLTILIDTGSTHSFIDIQTAREIKARLVAAAPLVVTVANGQKVLSKLQCPEFTWTMQGQEFKADLRVIRLEGSSVLLGIDWLRVYGKVTFDFQQNSITVTKDGQALVLKGMGEQAKLQLITAGQWYQELQLGECCVLSPISIEAASEGEPELPPELKEVLNQYSDVFEEPKELPPQRSSDHKIPLQPGATPVNIRPYRHAHEQKGEIERQIKEMLEAAIIRPSNSPFASPVLLVKKKDGT
ncbi:uncharacterized protein LOC109705849 [Ananas comosus]|uniref:Uncharacterized protein LOC109705849 n=1 Tax=Ananas comosus TaxID=4615 RepID=A0A6P5EFM8_ANACO|nr:uncharacterized protein LOC109705849 [Ananas comosus]